MEPHDLLTLDDRALHRYHAELDEDERRISRRRRRLHERIDFIAQGAYASAGTADETLAALRLEERAVSDERKALHRRIDAVRAERDRRAAPATPSGVA
jgi:hypothetical protein